MGVDGEEEKRGMRCGEGGGSYVAVYGYLVLFKHGESESFSTLNITEQGSKGVHPCFGGLFKC